MTGTRHVETTDERADRFTRAPAAPPAPTGAGGRASAAGRRLVAWTLVVLMAAGSIAMWLVAPVAWLYLASQMTSSTAPSAGPYLLVLAGLVVTFAIIGKALGALNRAHQRVTGAGVERRRATWLKSMRGERDEPARPNGVLEVVMLTSVSLALLVMAVWFFGFAGSSLPT
ncbi:MAG: hypothetical protein HZB46_18880 [Solirubrobacterales bacterium]|nr:hypothetical protein [Solirubrobacterales bacterium]